MEWQEVFAILIPIVSLMGFFYMRIDKKSDKIIDRIENVDQSINSLNMRLTRLEGRFEERGYWESRAKIIPLEKEEK